MTSITLVAGIVGFGLRTRQGSFHGLLLGGDFTGISPTWTAPIHSRIVDPPPSTTGNGGLGFGLVRATYLLFGATGGYVVGVPVPELGGRVIP